mgnify:CR=1 FL=1
MKKRFVGLLAVVLVLFGVYSLRRRCFRCSCG